MVDEHKLRKPKIQNVNRRDFDIQLDELETKIERLKVLYEQYFIDVVPMPSESLHKEIQFFVRELIKSPFKTAAGRFRLNALINRYQTYNTYWERVKKQREDGTYRKDVFKAEVREKSAHDLRRMGTDEGRADKSIKQLYDTYEKAVIKYGGKAEMLSYDAFKKSLVDNTKDLGGGSDARRMSYKVIVRDGKVVVRAETKK